MTNRFFMQSSDNKPDDDLYAEKALDWLVQGNEKLLLYIPSTSQVENSYLSGLIDVNYSAKKAAKMRLFLWRGR